ncbi:N-acetylmuramoyl-L-alanine amidase [Enterococcus sp.]|uniref:N-acetylmuramoyl-L-alanine amidase n=1 Tax=Enterococcus sp. TaxID=35783 RepID=UPI00289B369C|nr:N-acetylmuramoyl-L-alanine amidase [Enterococcus sp.]
MVKYNNSTSHRGHNAIVPGASGCGLKEHEVAQKIHDKFRAVTKAVDATDNVGKTANDNLYNIVKKMNAVGKSFHVSHHLNAFNGTANGFEVWYYAGNEEARKLAQAICDAVCAVTGWVNRGAKATTSLYVIRASTGAAVLIEWGFVDSQKDMDIMASKMDEAVNAALEVFGYNTTSSNVTSNTPKQEVITQGSATKIDGLGYRLHVQSKAPYKAGTLGYVKEGETAGTTGKGLRAEWLEVLYDGKGSPFEIDTHVQKKGWLGYRKGSQGTKGESLRMEAVRIRIADAALAKTHSIMYRVHSQTYGWGAWVKDGAIAGTTGKSKRMEAIQIKLVKK